MDITEIKLIGSNNPLEHNIQLIDTKVFSAES